MKDENKLKIKDLLKIHPKGLTIEEVAKELSLSRTTATKYLHSLMVAGQADMRTLGMAKLFSLAERVPLNNMLSLAHDFIVILDSDFFIQEINDSFISFLQVSKNELKGRRLENSPLAQYFDDEKLTGVR